MSKYAIRVHEVGKKYRIGEKERYRMFRDVLRDNVASALKSSRGAKRENGQKEQRSIWALKDVSFEVQPGEILGIIGNNGAGKSTLLKILSRVTVPSEGYAHLRGRIGSLLEVGTGFHPELTGRENIYLNGAILGMRKREIDKKFEEIVDFSEVGKFLDTPVKFFSSGMAVRLAFSVAAHLNPEILLIDEVLGVGDVTFQKKSIRRMEEVTSQGKTVIFVSHNMAAIRSLCQSGIYLDKGKIVFWGEANETVDKYLESREIRQDEQSKASFAPDPTIPIQILSIAIKNSKEETMSSFSYKKAFEIALETEVRKSYTNAVFELSILNNKNETVISTYDFEGEGLGDLQYNKGKYSFLVKIPDLLSPGEYRLSANVIRKGRHNIQILDSIQEACPFEIIDTGSKRSQAGLPWSGVIATAIEWQKTSYVKS